MTSFYGGGSCCSGGGSGTDNYNDLLNTPIKNITGSSLSPIVLSSLAYGVYNFTGSFKHTENSVPNTVDSPMQIVVMEDSVTKTKVVKYETFEDGKYYINTLSIASNGTVIEDKMLVGGEQSSIVTEISSEVRLSLF